MHFRLVGYAATLLAACSPLAFVEVQAQTMTGGHVVAGSAQIVTGQSGQTSINQSTTKAVIEWQSLSVENGELLRFVQPDSRSITLNRVVGDQASRINGSIEANGQVWLLNPNGVMIGDTGRVSAAGFLASSHTLSDEAFLAGRYDFAQPGSVSGAITNRGSIVANGGYAVLAGNQVANTGLIEANLGQIAIGAGKSFTLDLVGDKLISFAVTAPLDVIPANGAAISNSGTLRANGGRVLLTARAAADVVDNVINTSGLVQAQSARLVNGEIVLDGGVAGTVRIDGALDVSGTRALETGGKATVLGDTIILGDTARLDARGTNGGGSLMVGGGWQGETLYGRPSAIRVTAAAGAVLDASAIDTGNGGTVVLWSDVHNTTSRTYALGSFYARGGANGGDGGRIETSGRYLSTQGARGSAAAARGKAGLWLFDPTDIEIYEGSSSLSGSFVPDGDGQRWVPDEDLSYITATDIAALLNAGTNVFITTTGAGEGMGNLTVSAPISKTSGSAATLSLVAHSDLSIFTPITSTSGLSLSLESKEGRVLIGGPIDIDGNLTVLANSSFLWIPSQPMEAPFQVEAEVRARNISITSPDVEIYTTLTASESITIQPFSVEQPVHVGLISGMPGVFALNTREFAQLHAPTVTLGRADSTASLWFGLDLEDPNLPSLYEGPQTVVLRSGGSGGAIRFGRGYNLGDDDVLRLIAGSDIFLESDLVVDLAGRLDLISGQRVTNLAGTSAFAMRGSGRWFISAATPDDVTFGGLVSGQNALWNTTFANAVGASDNTSGNRYAFALSPTVTVTTTDRQKVEGETLTFSPADYTVAGFVDAARYGNVFAQDGVGSGLLLSSSGAAPSAAVGTYAIEVDSAQLPAGYTLSYAGASLTVTPVSRPPEPPPTTLLPLPAAIITGVTQGLPQLPPVPPLPPPVAAPTPAAPLVPVAAPPSGTRPASGAGEGGEGGQLTFLIAPQDPISPMPASPVSAQQPATPRDYADGDDPFLWVAENGETDSPPQNAERQGGSVNNVAPGVGVETAGMPPSPEIPGIEGRFSGTGDMSRW